MLIQIASYSLATPMIEDVIEHEIVATIVVTSSKPLQSPRTDCQIHKYFSHEEKKSVHLLSLDLILKESQKREFESIMITLKVLSSSGSLEFFVMIHQVTLVSSFSECLEFFPEILQIFVNSSDVIPLVVFDVRPHRKPIYLLSYF